MPQSVDQPPLRSRESTTEEHLPFPGWGAATDPDDGRLVDRVERALRATGYMALRDIAVTAMGGVVRLVGRVPSYYLKQIAQSAAQSGSGTHQVRNELNVIRPT
jgi:osmotically-inducible protein OsmY